MKNLFAKTDLCNLFRSAKVDCRCGFQLIHINNSQCVIKRVSHKGQFPIRRYLNPSRTELGRNVLNDKFDRFAQMVRKNMFSIVFRRLFYGTDQLLQIHNRNTVRTGTCYKRQPSIGTYRDICRVGETESRFIQQNLVNTAVRPYHTQCIRYCPPLDQPCHRDKVFGPVRNKETKFTFWMVVHSQHQIRARNFDTLDNLHLEGINDRYLGNRGFSKFDKSGEIVCRVYFGTIGRS